MKLRYKQMKTANIDEPQTETHETPNTKLSPPWVTHAKYLSLLFEKDPEVTVTYDEEANEVTLNVTSQKKGDALKTLLPDVIKFGNVDLKCRVVTEEQQPSVFELAKNAFENNDITHGIRCVETPFGPVVYLILEPEIAQFYNDEMNDPDGMKTMLYEDIAKEVFPDSTIRFCTKRLK